MHRLRLLLVLVTAATWMACGDDDGPNPGTPDGGTDAQPLVPVAPTNVEMVTTQGFEAPMDAVASPDGKTFYFSAYTTTPDENDEVGKAAIFAVPSAGGTPEILYAGEPLEDPSGLVLSCDGTKLYIADMGHGAGEVNEDPDAPAAAPLYTLDVASKALMPFAATGVGESASLAISKDCNTMYITGYTNAGVPAVFTVSVNGGMATTLKEGAPLESPSGVYVDAQGVAWVMDHRPTQGENGALFAIQPNGDTTPVIEDLRLSTPAGVSLVAGGGIAVIPTRDENNQSQLITVEIATGEMTVVQATSMVEPAGIRTAIGASIMAVVDADGDAIYRAE